MRRIMSFLDPNCLADYFDSCYQPLHGVRALAGGGVFGLGLGPIGVGMLSDHLTPTLGEAQALRVALLASLSLFVVGVVTSWLAYRAGRRREDRRRVEVGQAKKVDRSVHTHQGDGVKIADDSVLPDGCVATGHRLRA